MIKIDKISKSFGDEKVVEDLSLEIKKGQVFGFLGPNGAGKTTTMKMAVGLAKPSSGTLTIAGKEIETRKEIIGYMPEDPYFYDHLSAYEFLDFMQNLFEKKGQRPEKLLALVGLGRAQNQKIFEFSKGMKQRLGLAQALVNKPSYLFLDEPLDGLDPIGRREFKEIFLNLKKQGTTIFFNSHILSDVEEICDSIGVINRGKLIYSGNVKSFCGNKSLEDAFVDKIKAIKS